MIELEEKYVGNNVSLGRCSDNEILNNVGYIPATERRSHDNCRNLSLHKSRKKKVFGSYSSVKT